MHQRGIITRWRVWVGPRTQTRLSNANAAATAATAAGYAASDAATDESSAAGNVAIIIWAIPSSMGDFRRRGPAVIPQGITCSRPRKV